MKRENFIIVLVLVVLAACNNKGEKQPNVPIVIADTEQIMKDIILQFPDSLLLKEKLIQYYRENSSYDKAIAATNETLQKDSLNPRLWDIKATLYFENGDTLNAIKSFEKAIQILPDPGYIMSLGSLYAQTKNARALDMAEILLQDKNANAEKEAFFLKGLYFNYTGDKARAISFFDKCLLLDYTFMFGYREKAIALYDLGKYEEAIKVLDKAVTLQNNFDEGYYWRGRCLEKLNKPNEAIEEYRTALMYSPDFVEAKEALSKLEPK